MKLLISEYSSGFADSTYPLCNELAKYDDLQVTYISDKNNPYVDDVSKKVHKEMLFDVFANDEQHKKWSVKWIINRIITALLNCRKRNRYVKEHMPDVTLIELTMSAIDCHFIRHIKPYTKVVYTVHDVVVPIKSMSWSFNSLKKMYDVADAMVVHTESNKEQLINDFKISESKILVIPHGIEIEYKKLDKNACKKELGISEDEKVLLFYGGIRESKGLDILLDAMKGIDAVLIIAGAMPYGESFAPYKEKIESNQIKTIEYLTFTDDEFRDVLFQAADYLVLPYKEFSSQSGVLMQGIRYHLPVIATDVGSFKEYVEKYGIGYCCKASDSMALRNVIMKAFEAMNTENSFDVNLKKTAQENSWENSGKMYHELILNIGKKL